MDITFTDKQKKALLGVARKVAKMALSQKPISDFSSEDDLFNAALGCFVSLHNKGQLRGCIGQFQPTTPLINTISQMAVAVTADSRVVGNPVTFLEMEMIDIEISVLSPMVLAENPLDLELGVHGIYIISNNRCGCYLPQVATDTGWDKEQFLSSCCSDKAGLPADAWRTDDSEVYLYTATVFSDDH